MALAILATFNAALAEAKRVGAAKVVLKPGTYRCFDKTGVIIDESVCWGHLELKSNNGGF